MLALCKTTWFNCLIKGISFDQHKIEDRMTVNLNLNAGALRIVNRAHARINELGLEVSKTEANGTFLDFGIKAKGGIQAGLELARACMSGLAKISLAPSHLDLWKGPAIAVATDHPVLSCLASQYAGWQIAVGKFFAMGSGPMRAHYGSEDLFNHIPGREKSPHVVGILETSKAPDSAVFDYLSSKLELPHENITLLGAPTGSIAGSIQIVARSVETAMHKLHELKFPIDAIKQGAGWAPLAPPSPDFTEAIGRTNDAILYGAAVHLWVDTEDDIIASFGPKVPSNSSSDHGQPFAEIFRKVKGDFYKIDPLLFSPASVHFYNLKTGRCFQFGKFETNLLNKSWN